MSLNYPVDGLVRSLLMLAIASYDFERVKIVKTFEPEKE
jgi:hypothetical protein